MTAGATHGQAQYGSAQDSHLGGHHVEAFGQIVLFGAVGGIGPHAQEPGRHQPIELLCCVGFGATVIEQFIAGDLFGQESIVRLVLVERSDHVVAVAIGMGPDVVGRNGAFRIGVAHGVEPVASPAFAIVGRIQQAIDHPLVGVRPGVGQISLGFLGRRGKSNQVYVGPT